jgi:hypothetical protein
MHICKILQHCWYKNTRLYGVSTKKVMIDCLTNEMSNLTKRRCVGLSDLVAVYELHYPVGLVIVCELNSPGGFGFVIT